jgi:hypothetical protein
LPPSGTKSKDDEHSRKIKVLKVKNKELAAQQIRDGKQRVEAEGRSRISSSLKQSESAEE